MKNREERKERIAALLKSGCFLGLVLLSSALLAFSLEKNTRMIISLLPWFPAILAGYLAVGILVMWLYTKPKRATTKIGQYVRGITFVNIGWLILWLVPLIAMFVLPEALRVALGVNIIVLFVLWALDFSSLVRTAKELNGHKWQRKRVLLADLDHCPKDREEFFAEIEKYCIKNHLSLEYVEKNNPAIIKLDGMAHMVKVEYSNSRVGPMYSLKFEELE